MRVLAILALLVLAACNDHPFAPASPAQKAAFDARYPDLAPAKKAKPKRMLVKASPKPQKRAVVNVKTGKPVVVGKPVEKPKGRVRRFIDRIRGR